MIRLNLISPKQKKELNLLRVYFLVKSFSLGILWITLLVSITLSMVRLLMHNNFIILVEETTKVNKTNYQIAKKIKIVNKIIKEANAVTVNSHQWSNALISIAEIFDDQNKMTQLSINQQNNSLQFSGLSESPEDFSHFKDRLLSHELLNSVKIPENYLFETDSFSWTIVANINLDKL